MSEKNTADEIRALLEAAFAPATLEIEDESWKHAGHAGAGRGGHFHVRIGAAAFRNKSRIRCHRMVNAALQPLFPERIHALSIRIVD